MDLLNGLMGALPLIAVGLAFFLGRYLGWQGATDQKEKELARARQEESERQVKAQDEVMRQLEEVWAPIRQELEELKEKANQHEIESVTSPDANSPGLSSERMQRLNSIGGQVTSGSTSAPTTRSLQKTTDITSKG